MGFCVAMFIAVAGKLTRFDQDKSFYPVVLMVIASYYVLFAVMANESIVIELIVAICFAVFALLGVKKAPIMIGIGLILHGLYDIVHIYIYSISVAPNWWPEFCASVDITLGIWVVYLSVKLVNEQSAKN